MFKYRALFFVLIAASLLLWWRPLVSAARLALESDAHTHMLLILPLVGGMIYLQVRNATASRSTPSQLAGGCVLAGAAIVAITSKWSADVPSDVRLSLAMLALVLWWVGSALLCFGSQIVRSCLFPVFFLLWIVPIPDSPLNWLIGRLQMESATAARILFQIARVPVRQDGIVLSIPGLDIEVASQCSSIRSSLFLLITTMFVAHLLLRSWWRKSLAIAAAIPLAAIKNGLRIFVIAELGTRVDPGFLVGDFHHHGGIVFFALSMMAAILLIWGLRRTERRNTVSKQAAATAG